MLIGSKTKHATTVHTRTPRPTPDLLPYILQMEVVWARLISISSDRLCFQCRMSVSFSASINLWATFPCVAPCWTRD